jgi:hypothetical protein
MVCGVPPYAWQCKVRCIVQVTTVSILHLDFDISLIIANHSLRHFCNSTPKVSIESIHLDDALKLIELQERSLFFSSETKSAPGLLNTHQHLNVVRHLAFLLMKWFHLIWKLTITKKESGVIFKIPHFGLW